MLPTRPGTQVVLATVLYLWASAVTAVYVYKYQGERYSDATPPYATTMRMRATIVVPTLLARFNGDVGSFARVKLSDGINAFQTGVAYLGTQQLVTNGNGDVTDWLFDASSPNYQTAVPGDIVWRAISTPENDEALAYKCRFVIVTCTFRLQGSARATSGAWTLTATHARTFARQGAFAIPDDATRFRDISLRVTGITGPIDALWVSVKVDVARRNDLSVLLISPAGRSQWVSRRTGGTGPALERKHVNVTARFRNTAPNGFWRLRVTDLKGHGTAILKSFTLEIAPL